MKLLIKGILFASVLFTVTTFAQNINENSALKTKVFAINSSEYNAVLHLPITVPHVPSVIPPNTKTKRYIGTYPLKPGGAVFYLIALDPHREYTVQCGRVGRHTKEITITASQAGEESFKCTMQQS